MASRNPARELGHTVRMRVRACYDSLVQNLRVVDHLDYWYEVGVIEMEEMQRISAKDTENDKVRQALNIILEKPGQQVVDFRASFDRDDRFEHIGQMIDQQSIAHLKRDTKEKAPATDLRIKLTQLICQGESSMDGDNFYILVTSKAPATASADDMKQFEFVKNIKWRAVFDFDDAQSKSSLYHYLEDREQQVMQVIVVDDGQSTAASGDPKDPVDTKETSLTPWVFANGYEPLDAQPMGVAAWKKTRIKGYKKLVRKLDDDIPKDRALVIFALLSDDLDVMLEAAEELCTTFTDQWCVIAESTAVAETWKQGMENRNLASELEVRDRCVAGMPWEHVNATFKELLNVEPAVGCELPSSSGAFITLPEKMKNELVDLDVLGRNLCQPTDYLGSKKHRIQVGEKFYKGSVVDWWNLSFGDQVRRRSIHDDMQQDLEQMLSGKEQAQVVEQATLFYQPGAGGSTTARHVLWELKSKFRCAVVKQITEQTIEQLLELRRYKDEDNPKPVLLLFDDDNEEERINDLKYDLESCLVQKKRVPHDQVAFVFFVCQRKTTVPKSTDLHRYILKQKLTDDELHWFNEKHKELTNNFREKGGVDPRHLFGFNILKENFNPDYIKRTVADFLKDVRLERERKLLLYISLLNSYDTRFQFVPTSSFDALMKDEKSAVKVRWECRLSQALKVLLYQKGEAGAQQDLKIFHKSVSGEVLESLMGQAAAPILLCDLMLEFLNSGIFQTRNESIEQLLKVVGDVVKRRARKPNKRYETTFAPLIHKIVADGRQGIAKAVEVTEQVFNMTDDAFVGQQIARLYISSKNWKKAILYGRKITRKIPTNSFLWDTYARIFKDQVAEYHLNMDRQTVPASDVLDVLGLTFQAVDIFRKVQTLSEEERRTEFVNTAGYLGAVQVVTCLLECLGHVEELSKPKQLHNFLIGNDVETSERLKAIWGNAFMVKLAKLEQFAVDSLHKLEDEQLVDQTRTRMEISSKDLITFKEKLDHFYGEESDEVPKGLSEEQACAYRRRRVFSLSKARNTFSGLFRLHEREDGTTALQIIRTLMEGNSRSQYANAFDYTTLITVNLVLSSLGSKCPVDVRQDTLAALSKQLYAEPEHGSSLEPYLYALLLNWPRRQPDTHHPFDPEVSLGEFQEIIQKWDAAFSKKYPKSGMQDGRYHPESSVLFYLGREPRMGRFVYERNRKHERARWRPPTSKLESWEGTLIDNGRKLQLKVDHGGNRHLVTIATAFPVNKQGYWNKRVRFVLGFTWSGPRGFDITLGSADQAGAEVVQPVEPGPTARAGPTPPPETRREDILRQRKELDKRLSQIEQIKTMAASRATPLNKKQQELLREEDHLEKKRREIQETIDVYSKRTVEGPGPSLTSGVTEAPGLQWRH